MNVDTITYIIWGLLGVLIVFGIIDFFRRHTKRKSQRTQKPSGQTNNQASGTSATQAAPAQPAPAPTVDSGGVNLKTIWPYLWPALLIGTILYVWGWKDTSTHKAGPTPQTRQQPKEHREKKALEFAGGKGYFFREGRILIKNGGYVIFKTNLPPNASRYILSFCALRASNGEHRLLINNQKDAFSCFTEKHFGDNRFQKINFVFTGESEKRFFREGENRFEISSPEDDVVIQNITLEVIF